ncbi:tyrosine-protein kinase Tec-like [Ruditapes philippinarum]|uniref:tyrosine-protein kinase Tec-like n=1 Tax=Ruditapes philippinarum TaxID=129788 RepID=UPI00295AABB8|nr:tyrosine-protein kinase Tec-like [Ruditapes philippinarum]
MKKGTVFTSQSYKERWFQLTDSSLTYYSGTLAKRSKAKGTICLNNVKTVETVEDGKLDDKSNVFQIMHRTEKGEGYYTLYIVAQSAEQQKKWVDTLKQTIKDLGVTFLPKYHTGVWTKTLGHYNCCDQIDRNAPGCQMIPDDGSAAGQNNAPRSNLPPLPDIPGQPKTNGTGGNRPVPAPRPPKREKEKDREKKMYIAAYDYKPCEEGDLELVTGSEYEVLDDSRDHWWLAKNMAGEKGFIPANYVKKKFDLEIYEWYYKGVTRERSEQILKSESREGCFMVRDSSTPGMYTLSIYTTET